MVRSNVQVYADMQKHISFIYAGLNKIRPAGGKHHEKKLNRVFHSSRAKFYEKICSPYCSSRSGWVRFVGANVSIVIT
jgi:hypothetical protein